MICPNCGRGEVAGKNYCPSCGLKLDAIAQVVAQEQAQLSGKGRTEDFPHLKERRSPSVFALSFLVVFFGLLHAFIGGAIVGDKLVANTGVLTMILGMGGIGYAAIKRIETARRSSPPKERFPQIATNPLPMTVQPASITEQTTRNLGLSLEDGEIYHPDKGRSLS